VASRAEASPERDRAGPTFCATLRIVRTSPAERRSLISPGTEDDMHSPGLDAHHHAVRTHHAAHHRAVDSHHVAHHRAAGMRHAAHGAAIAHARRSGDYGRSAFSTQLSGMPAARTVPRSVHPRRRRTFGLGKLLRFFFLLAVVAVLVGVVLLVLRPTHPEWLAQLVHEIDGLVRTLRSAVS
jgi:hypothetical protein